MTHAELVFVHLQKLPESVGAEVFDFLQFLEQKRSLHPVAVKLAQFHPLFHQSNSSLSPWERSWEVAPHLGSVWANFIDIGCLRKNGSHASRAVPVGKYAPLSDFDEHQ